MTGAGCVLLAGGVALVAGPWIAEACGALLEAWLAYRGRGAS